MCIRDSVFTDNGESLVYSKDDKLINKKLDGSGSFEYDLKLKSSRGKSPRAHLNSPWITSLYSENNAIFHLTSSQNEKCGPSSAYSLMRTPSNGGQTVKLSGKLKKGNCGVVRFGFTEDKKHVIYLSFEEKNGKLGFFKVASDGNSEAVKLFDKNY